MNFNIKLFLRRFSYFFMIIIILHSFLREFNALNNAFCLAMSQQEVVNYITFFIIKFYDFYMNEKQITN